MSLTVNAKTYNNDVNRGSDIMRYTGPSHTLSANDFIDLGRTAPKKTADYAGKGRARYKLTRNATNGTVSVGDGIIDCTVSLPVGMQSSEMDSLITDFFTWGLTAAAKAAFKDHDILQ